MCGIAGIYRRHGAPVPEDLLRAMTARLAHRDPDGDGFHVEPGLGFGHRRLSIIDVAGGAQPMSNEDGTIWVTFNGEILRLRREATLARVARSSTAYA